MSGGHSEWSRQIGPVRRGLVGTLGKSRAARSSVQRLDRPRAGQTMVGTARLYDPERGDRPARGRGLSRRQQADLRGPRRIPHRWLPAHSTLVRFDRRTRRLEEDGATHDGIMPMKRRAPAQKRPAAVEDEDPRFAAVMEALAAEPRFAAVISAARGTWSSSSQRSGSIALSLPDKARISIRDTVA